MPTFLEDYIDWLRFIVPYWRDEWRHAFLFTQALELPFYVLAFYLASKAKGRGVQKTDVHLGEVRAALAPEGERSFLWWMRSLVLAYGASAITHPFVWFFFPYFSMGRGPDFYWYVVVPAAEAFAVGVEAFYLHRLGVKRALGWALMANTASFGFGLLTRKLFGW